MGIVRAITGAVGGTFADQWKDIITAGIFDELTLVAPGVLKQSNSGRGTNFSGSDGVISNGSKIFVPENTAAFVFSQGGIENVITVPGGYEYQDGQDSVFNGDGVAKSILAQAKERIGYGGQTSAQKQIAFVNLREIRGIKFGTRGPLVYNDMFYQADLEIFAFGSFGIKVVDPEKFMRHYVPANVTSYSFGSQQARSQLLPEFLQSFIDALNTLSTKYRISQLPSQAEDIAESISSGSSRANSWHERFGLEIVSVGIENIEFTPESRELVRQFSSNRMNIRAYEDVSQQASNIGAQQKIAQGVQNHGLGDGAGLIFGMGLAQGLNPQTAAPVQPPVPPQATQPPVPQHPVQPPAPQQPAMSYDEQIATVLKLKDLFEAGILSESEFEQKKKEVMGL